MARDHGLNFIEINSKDYHKVEGAFKRVAEAILSKIETGSIPLNQGIGIKTGDQEKTGGLKQEVGNKKKNKQCC